jgi:hypothetical protein
MFPTKKSRLYPMYAWPALYVLRYKVTVINEAFLYKYKYNLF